MRDSSPISQSPEFCHGLLEAAPDAILVTDDQGSIVLVNAETERMFGHSRDELVGQPIEILIPERARAAHVAERTRYESAPRVRTMGSGLELSACRKDGSEFPVEISLSPLALQDRRLVIAIVRDVTDRMRTEANLWFLSTHDTLTGLYNRSYFQDRLARLERGRQYPVSILVLDVDGLKEINDTQGHAAGDALLERTARLLVGSLRPEDVIARIGGDEFAVLLASTDAAQVTHLIERLRNAQDRTADGGQPPTLRLSIGSATAQKGDVLADVLRRADQRMYEDKPTRGHRALRARK